MLFPNKFFLSPIFKPRKASSVFPQVVQQFLPFFIWLWVSGKETRRKNSRETSTLDDYVDTQNRCRTVCTKYNRITLVFLFLSSRLGITPWTRSIITLLLHAFARFLRDYGFLGSSLPRFILPPLLPSRASFFHRKFTNRSSGCWPRWY